MKIVSVTFRANAAVPGLAYSHVHVEATAQIGKNEKPETVLGHLKVWTLKELAKAQNDRKEITDAISLEGKIAKVETELRSLRAMRQDLR